MELRQKIREIAEARPRFGYRRVHLLLQREGAGVNKKKLYRIYREEGLAVRKRKRKRFAVVQRKPMEMPQRANVRWSMDFMSDTLVDGRHLRVLNIVDDYTRECLRMVVDRSIPGRRVVQVLEQLRETRGLPERIVTDNGPEFVGRALDQWAFERGVTLDFIRPGKPVENAFVESFNGKVRDEFLNMNWFVSVSEAQALAEEWRTDYNMVRPHGALGGMPPNEYARLAA